MTSVWSGSFVGGVAALASLLWVDVPSFLVALLGTLVLGPAQLLRSALLLPLWPIALLPPPTKPGDAKKAPAPPTAFARLFAGFSEASLARSQGFLAGALSLPVTAVSAVLLTTGFGGSDLESRTFGFLLGVWSAVRLYCSGPLLEGFACLAPESTRRRIESRFVPFLAEACLVVAGCVALASILGESALHSSWPRICAGLVIVVSAQCHGEAIKSSTALLSAVPAASRGPVLLEALAVPLSTTPGTPGFAHQLAFVTLAQAVSHQPRGMRARSSGTAAGAGASRTGAPPPLAKDVFGPERREAAQKDFAYAPLLSGGLPPLLSQKQQQLHQQQQQQQQQRQQQQQQQYGSYQPGQSSHNKFFFKGQYGPDVAGSLSASSGAQQSDIPNVYSLSSAGGSFASRLAAASSSTSSSSSAPPKSSLALLPAGKGLFASCLVCGIQTFKLFAAEVKAVSQLGLPAKLGAVRVSPAQAATALRLRAEAIVSLKLAVVAACAGLSGWICLSRDLDEHGVVQKEEGLPKTISELCQLRLALQSLRAFRLRGAAHLILPLRAERALEEVDREVKHGLVQLVLHFESAGLREIAFTPEQTKVLAEIC